MTSMLETPSRIWRRIEAEGSRDMPSLPSVPAFDDSAEELLIDDIEPSSEIDDGHELLNNIGSPIHSTPAVSHHASTIRATSSTSSTARFANSIHRSARSSAFSTNSRAASSKMSPYDSFDVSAIPSLPDDELEHPSDSLSGDIGDVGSLRSAGSLRRGREGVSEDPLQSDDNEESQEISLTDALESVSRASSPYPDVQDLGPTPKKAAYLDIEVPLKSTPKTSPFDRFRNVAMRRPLAERTRTPSLSRTTLSPASSPPNSTPRSTKSAALDRSLSVSPIAAASVPLPRSNTNSPAVVGAIPEPERSVSHSEPDSSSMDITETHISRLRHLPESDSEGPGEESSHDGVRFAPTEGEPSAEAIFSSDDGASPDPTDTERQPSRFPGGLASAFSSPAPSLATPTPAFPRPRARFNLPPPPEDVAAASTPDDQDLSDEGAEEDALVTPHTRRRSFLLSVINSTARPRLKFPTPHPRNRIPPDTPSVIANTPGPAIANTTVQNTPAPALRTAFAGATPRPRLGGRRMSHPLAQAYTASSTASDSESGESREHDAALSIGNAPVPWNTPAPGLSAPHLSPYDEGAGGASFLSTASSHDLTTHPRANTSFDPALGFGGNAPGHGVGRFNANKLNNYLHGLNRRLQEENESLMERLRKLDEEKRATGSTSVPATPATSVTASRRTSGGRRLSAASTLGDVKEDSGEDWMEEKAELEEMVETFKTEMTKCLEEKEEVEKALEKEQQERARDKERWKERMAEVEKGVEEIVRDLEMKLHAAEQQAKKAESAAAERIKEIERDLTEAQARTEDAVDRAQKAERAMADEQDLGAELRSANDRASDLMGELRNASHQIKELEEEVLRSDERIDQLEQEAQEQKAAAESLRKELDVKGEELQAQRTEIRHLEGVQQKTEEELQATKAYVAEIEEDAAAAVEQIHTLENNLASVKEELGRMQIVKGEMEARGEQLANEAERAAELARQMESALEAAETKMADDEEEVAKLKGKLAALEREKERQKELSVRSIEPSNNPAANSAHDAEIEALEEELDEATKEIARLQATLNQSPARKAMDKAKDAKIEMLEQENEALTERVKALRIAMNEVNTPSKIFNSTHISPLHRHALSMSIRAPRTPGGPLRDMSWLNSTANDPSLSPFVAEISRLQRELDRANDSIDDKIDKLEDAGLGVVGLTKKLEDARSRIRRLEDDIARLRRREDRRLHRLERARCQKCLTKVNLRNLIHPSEDESIFEGASDSLPTEPPTPPTKTSEALRANLSSVNIHLAEMKKQWANEKQQLLGEKAVLQDATNRLNVQIREARAEIDKASKQQKTDSRMRLDVQEDLEKARTTIAELENDLKAERARLRSMNAEQSRINKEREEILLQLQRTETDMEDVRSQLQSCKKENREMENELRLNTNAEQKARLLESKVAENVETIDHLREERAGLAAEYKALQQRFSEISEHANRLQERQTSSQTVHDKRRHELDLHMIEIEDLRRALSERSADLHHVEAEKNRIATERSNVAQTVASLEADLRRVRKDAEAFGRDLKLLRAEKERVELKQKEEQSRAERIKKQSQAQIRLLTEQLDGQKMKTLHAQEELEKHVCKMDERQLSSLKLQHNKECKGLIVQIRYLKAKFTRESMLRFDLAYQKQYLLVLLASFEKSERTIVASIARIGYPVGPPPPKPKRKLKTVVLAVVFLTRTRQVSEEWSKHNASKQAIAAALQDVRQRRTATTIS